MKKFISLLLGALMVGSMVACTPSEESGNNGGNGGTPTSNDFVMENDYVYMWQYDGLTGENCRMSFQSESYAMLVDERSGRLLGAESISAESSERKEVDFSNLAAVDMKTYLKIDGEYIENQDLPLTARTIESGRYVNRMDVVDLRYPGQGTSKYGRIEYVATKSHVAINYELYSVEAGVFDLAFSLSIEDTEVSTIENGRGIKVVDENGNGFAYLKQTADDTMTFNVSDSTVTFEKKNLSVSAKTFTGFGIIAIPVCGNSDENVKNFLAIEALEVKAKNVVGGASLPVRYESTDAIWVIDVSSLAVGSQTMQSGRDGMERVAFEILNSCDNDVIPTIAFVKENVSFSVTGMSPVIRTVDTLEPTGEQVQISKNWHHFQTTNTSAKDYAEEGSHVRLYEGQWYHGYTSIVAIAKNYEKREYSCVYGNWGGVYAASHAQLCLIGWGGNQLWDQSALGSWGESVTYDPDIGLNRSMIDDVRPFLVRDPSGANNSNYNWSGNVGGGDFLNYIEDGEQRIVNQKITYKTQAPNMTNVVYSGVTANGKVGTQITINLGRTDDIVRNYYTIKYTFLDDVEYGRLSLFKIAADNYADNEFTKFAYGTEAGAIAMDENAYTGYMGYEGFETKDAPAKEFWFTLYDSSDSAEGGDVGFIVRKFSADINGKHYDKPGYTFYGIFDDTSQISCEVSLPTACGKKIKKGSVVEMVVEYDVLPNNTNTYYGASDYLLLSSSVMGSADAMYQQVVGGNISVTASKGTVLSQYPVAIKTVGGSIAAQFEMTGGLGYTPISFTGLQSFSGYQLQVKNNGAWEDVNQAVKGNDYWQVYKANDGTYTLTYNVKNTDKLNFNMTREYRLIYAE